MTKTDSTIATEGDVQVTLLLNGAQMIATERRRQVEAEGWSAEYDDDEDHEDGVLAAAAICYAGAAIGRYTTAGDRRRTPTTWPWDRVFWKPSSPIRMLVKAGALIAAEIDRRLRAGEQP